jgi:hypothetical protein
MTRLLWLSAGLASGPLSDGLGHDSASVRYRLLLPARAMAHAGIASDILNPQDAAAMAAVDLAVYRAVVICKHAHHDPAVAQVLGDRIITLVKKARELGVRTIADVCDDRFEHPLLGAYWRELVGLVDCVAAGSDAMADIARQRTALSVTTISDPVEGERAEPRFAPPRRRGWLERLSGAGVRPLKLLWYGHQSNLDEVTEFVPRLAAWATTQKMTDGIALGVVSAPGFGVEDLAGNYNAVCGRFLQISFLPWSAVAQAQALRDCDLVVIPATLDAAQKRVKSANRLTEALWAGRHVLAHPVPSYAEFRDCAWIGGDLLTGLAAALRNPCAVPAQLRAAQEIIRQRYSPEAVGRLWADAVLGA